jgi:GTP cyclohydrolase II
MVDAAGLPAEPGYHGITVDSSVGIAILGGAAEASFVRFRGLPDTEEHFALKLGRPDKSRTLVRIHSECLTGDVFGSVRCDCGQQLHEALNQLNEEGGYLIYLRQEGRGIGLYGKLAAYALQDQGLDTFDANLRLGHPADARAFAVAAQMLRALGLRRLTLLTNNPLKIKDLRDAGLDVHARRTSTFVTPQNRAYLRAKREKAGHRLDLIPPDGSEGEGSSGASG